MPIQPKKTEQLNIRWTVADILTIREIAAREEQRQSDAVRFLVRYAIAHYRKLQSFRLMKHAREATLYMDINRDEHSPVPNIEEMELKNLARDRTILAMRSDAKLEEAPGEGLVDEVIKSSGVSR